MVALAVLWLVPAARAVEEQAPQGPVRYVYAVNHSVELAVYVFPPAVETTTPGAALAVFHGGGWNIGRVEWAFSTARRFADKGMVGVAVQYRLSNHANITPLEAMADARDAIRWMRANADTLGVDPERIAAYGWSAGGHLATGAAIFDDEEPDSPFSSAPDALLLESPAVSLVGDGWFQELLGDRARAREVSPDEHVRPGLPPTLIVQGDVDTVTPLAGAERFCERMRAAGNVCELKVYEGYGHLCTPAGTADDGVPKPDPAIQADATARMEEFLASLGFMQ